MKIKVCKTCNLIITTNLCPNCKSNDISDDWTGLVTIINPEKSQIAKVLDIKKGGRYALRVR